MSDPREIVVTLDASFALKEIARLLEHGSVFLSKEAVLKLEEKFSEIRSTDEMYQILFDVGGILAMPEDVRHD